MGLVALVLAPVVTWPAPGAGARPPWLVRLAIQAGAVAAIGWVVVPWSREVLRTGHSSDPYGAPVPLAAALAAGLALARLRLVLRRARG